MAAFVAVTEIASNSSASASASVTATASDALIVIAAEYNATSPTMTVSVGGTWTTDQNTATDTGGSRTNYTIGLASCPSATGGTNTVTVSWSAGSLVTSFLMEFSGMANPVLDAVGSTNAAISSSPSTASQTNANANDVMVAGIFDGAASNPSFSAPTNSWTLPTGGQEDNASIVTGCVVYKIVSASATQSVSVTNNQLDPYYSLIAAYKQGSGLPPGSEIGVGQGDSSAQAAMMR